MFWYHYLLIGLGALILLFIAVVLIRTLLFKPSKITPKTFEKEEFNKDLAVENLRELIKCKTISDYDKNKEDEKEFQKLYDLLPKLYPFVINTCEKIEIEHRGLLYKWLGKNHDKPAVLMAHYDVVSVVEENWDKPPFEAIIENGVLWGRGTLDTKVTFNAIMFSVNHLIKQGFVPENDIYLAFSGGEEINGLGAVDIVNYFKNHAIAPHIVVDEGGAVVENVFPGVKQPCGLIGIAEKGMMDVEYKVLSAGGHASAPKPNTPVRA